MVSGISEKGGMGGREVPDSPGAATNAGIAVVGDDASGGESGVVRSSDVDEALGEDAGESLTPLEVEVIDLFVNAVRLVGISKSVGEIYGLLYISPEPLTLDAIVGKLRISKGSASQGMRFLRSLGAVRPVYVAGERRDHFAAVAELKQLVSGFIREELLPHLETGAVRLERLRGLSAEAGTAPGPDPDFYALRVAKLEQWQRRARQLLPFVNRVLGD